MYGFWRLGLRPAPSVGATCVANGLETATSMNAKKLATRASTGTTHATRSAAVRRARATASVERPVRTISQSRSEPSWPPQKAEIVYGVGSLRLVCSATYVNEKSCLRSAASSTIAATTVDAKAAKSAF